MSSVAFLGFQNAPKSLVVGALPQAPLGEITALPRPLAGFKGPTYKGPTSKGREGGGKRGTKVMYAPGRQKPLRRHCTET